MSWGWRLARRCPGFKPYEPTFFERFVGNSGHRVQFASKAAEAVTQQCRSRGTWVSPAAKKNTRTARDQLAEDLGLSHLREGCTLSVTGRGQKVKKKLKS